MILELAQLALRSPILGRSHVRTLGRRAGCASREREDERRGPGAGAIQAASSDAACEQTLLAGHHPLG